MERSCPAFETTALGFKSCSSQSRVWHSNTVQRTHSF